MVSVVSAVIEETSAEKVTTGKQTAILIKMLHLKTHVNMYDAWSHV
jgi:hypothetical protein